MRNRLLVAAQTSRDYAGAELRPETQELVIYAVSPPTESMAALMNEASPNIHVTWRHAPYRLAELIAELPRLMAAQPARVISAGPRHDGPGIQITTTDTELLRTDDPQGLLGAHYPIWVEYGESPTALQVPAYTPSRSLPGGREGSCRRGPRSSSHPRSAPRGGQGGGGGVALGVSLGDVDTAADDAGGRSQLHDTRSRRVTRLLTLTRLS